MNLPPTANHGQQANADDKDLGRSKPWLMKVLNGPHAGAQILISQEEIAVGSAADCDLVLNDPHIRPHHCQLKKGDADALELIVKEGIVFINGKKLEEEKGVLKMGDVLTIGSTHLAAGPSDQLWPSVTLPEIQEVGGVYQPIASTTAKASVIDSKEGISGNIPTQKPSYKISPQSFKLLKIIIVFLVIGAGLLGVVFYRNGFLPKQEFTPTAFEAEELLAPKKELFRAEILATELRKKIPQSIIKPISNNGSTVLTIYIVDPMQRDEVSKIINDQRIPIPFNIVTISEIQESARTMIKSLNLSLTVVIDRFGKATWMGYLSTHHALDELQQQVGRDLPSITENEYNIVFGDTIAKKVREILMQYQFGMVRVLPEQSDILLIGTISFSDKDRWKKTLHELESQFSDQVPFVDKVITGVIAERLHGVFNSPIVSVSVSHTPYAVLQNGEHIFIGAKVDDGYEVESITTQGIGLKSKMGKKLIPMSSVRPPPCKDVLLQPLHCRG
ncbi:MAG TPA: FHA domain-containing protein [Chthoniobacterales bacterium]|nr:FHA domain-containing protein [Chthoniobacterales bacterium]